ncbi:hypothetical protein [Nocardia asteroides]|uniref:hypothetical protein n=1 Tax=Nocardia asteroides TaxID=1824 RepID=UPI001E42F643|nr:hypothetical protein [Nocardia asteroides]UGT59494.1 hypothetical protein LTT61_19820 [Nocardia asteroides]
MTDQNEMRRVFTALESDATDGRLIVEQGVAEACAAECERYIEELTDLAYRTENLDYAASFGALRSSQALGGKFRDLAMGGVGSGSFRDALRQHIEVVQAMAEMFRKANAAYDATESANTSDIDSTVR